MSLVEIRVKIKINSWKEKWNDKIKYKKTFFHWWSRSQNIYIPNKGTFFLFYKFPSKYQQQKTTHHLQSRDFTRKFLPPSTTSQMCIIDIITIIIICRPGRGVFLSREKNTTRMKYTNIIFELDQPRLGSSVSSAGFPPALLFILLLIYYYADCAFIYHQTKVIL